MDYMLINRSRKFEITEFEQDFFWIKISGRSFHVHAMNVYVHSHVLGLKLVQRWLTDPKRNQFAVSVCKFAAECNIRIHAAL